MPDKNFLVKAIGFGLLYFFFFLGIFSLLQDSTIYSKTLGKISTNYERTEGWSGPIVASHKPFATITNDSLENWDADVYACLREKMYEPGTKCYDEIRGAFFPLFPLIWKYTGFDAKKICIYNYLLLVISLALMISQLVTGSTGKKMQLFILSMTLPSVVMYFIPYTEALFLFTMALAATGILRKNYSLYFIGALLLAMTRPATIFVLFAIGATEVLTAMKEKNAGVFLKNIFRQSLPFVCGYFLVTLIQYTYTHSWRTYLDAQSRWEGAWTIPKKISDWSIEGFGMSVFAIFFVCIPALIALIRHLIKSISKNERKPLAELEPGKNYLWIVSIIYLVSMLLFTIFYSAGNLHSFSRFTLASPLFYILLFIGQDKIKTLTSRNKILVVILPLTLLFIFLFCIVYGGSRWSFPFAGLFLFILSYLFYFFSDKLNKSLQYVFLFLLVAMNTVWSCYLLNMFICNGWIFT